MVNTIGNPLSWAAKTAISGGEKAVELTQHVGSDRSKELPVVNKIGIEDIHYAVRKGVEDLGAILMDSIRLGHLKTDVVPEQTFLTIRSAEKR